jgi:hypothetical protein
LGGACDDVRLCAREGVQMRLEHLDGSRRIAEEGEDPASAIRRFVEAVQELSDDPRPENVERYLLASRALEGPGSKGTPRRGRAA